MIASHTMRYATDIFGLYEDSGESGGDETEVTSQPKSAFLISNSPINCTKKTNVTGIVVEGNPGSANCERRFMFKIDDVYYTLTSSGTKKKYSKEPNWARVIQDGNTAEFLAALTDVPAFAGKNIYPIIALSAPADATAYPTAKLKVQTRGNDLLSTTDIFPDKPIELAQDDTDTPRIVEIVADTTCTGNASVKVQVRFYDSLTGSPSTWSSLEDAIDREAKAVQFQITKTVGELGGSDSAKLNSISIDHTLGKSVVSGEDADLYTQTVNYDNDLKVAYCVVRHEPLQDAYIRAYVNFSKAPKERNLLAIGTSTGSTQTLTLGENSIADEGIIASTIQLYADDIPLTDFSYNSEVSTVTFKTKKSRLISATYQYERGSENWLRMTNTLTEPYHDHTVMSRFEYSLPAEYTNESSIANIRLRLIKDSGSVTNVNRGLTTGKKQILTFKHVYKKSSIKFSDDRLDYEYDPDTGILILTAPAKDIPIIFSGKWTGVAPVIYSLVAGFSVA